MKKVEIREGKLYLGTAKEISHAYRVMCDREIATPVFTEKPHFNPIKYYGLLVTWELEMCVVSGDMALFLIYDL